MTSYLIISSDKEKREAFALAFARDKQIDLFDITILALELEDKSKKTAPKQSIGIEEIKILQQKIYLKPMRSLDKAIIINDAQFLTTEAQNAMLKILEEPPEHTIILLTAESSESLLPTIMSRCSVISLEETKKEHLREDEADSKEFFTSLPTFTIAQALARAEKASKTKQEALFWLETTMLVIRKTYLHGSSADAKIAALVIIRLQNAYTSIKTTNVNIRMTLEQVFLSFV